MDWNIYHSTYDKTALDVKFCEGGPLVWSLRAVFMINVQNSNCKIHILSFNTCNMVIALLWAVFVWNGLVLSRRSGNPGCMEQPERSQCHPSIVCAIKPLKDFSKTKKRHPLSLNVISAWWKGQSLVKTPLEMTEIR